MLHRLPGWLKGSLAFVLMILHTLAHVVVLTLAAFAKLVVPWRPWRKVCDRVLNTIATSWIGCNNFILRLFNKIEWEVSGLEGLDRRQWYLVLANHQSWTDILVLQRVFNRKVPFLKFFLKKELIWVPVMGFAWWALDFPFMKRYSKAKLAKKPHLAGRDVAITAKACQKFKHIPISVMNFVEGTRFSRDKHQAQESPYAHLLRPKAAGIAVVLSSMGHCLNHMLDVTIAYPKGAKGMWALLCGKVQEVRVRVEAMPITKEQLGDYFNDLEYRQRFQDWLNELWREKDRRLGQMLAKNN